MLKTPKNKMELISALKDERDFAVLGVEQGRAQELARELAKMGVRDVLLIVIQSK